MKDSKQWLLDEVGEAQFWEANAIGGGKRGSYNISWLRTLSCITAPVQPATRAITRAYEAQHGASLPAETVSQVKLGLLVIRLLYRVPQDPGDELAWSIRMICLGEEITSLILFCLLQLKRLFQNRVMSMSDMDEDRKWRAFSPFSTCAFENMMFGLGYDDVEPFLMHDSLPTEYADDLFSDFCSYHSIVQARVPVLWSYYKYKAPGEGLYPVGRAWLERMFSEGIITNLLLLEIVERVGLSFGNDTIRTHLDTLQTCVQDPSSCRMTPDQQFAFDRPLEHPFDLDWFGKDAAEAMKFDWSALVEEVVASNMEQARPWGAAQKLAQLVSERLVLANRIVNVEQPRLRETLGEHSFPPTHYVLFELRKEMKKKAAEAEEEIDG